MLHSDFGDGLGKRNSVERSVCVGRGGEGEDKERGRIGLKERERGGKRGRGKKSISVCMYVCFWMLLSNHIFDFK